MVMIMTKEFLAKMCNQSEFIVAEPIDEKIHNTMLLQRKLADDYLAPLFEKINGDAVVCNGVVASFIQDLAGFSLNPIPLSTSIGHDGDPYIAGNYMGSIVYVDPYMRYADCRIFSVPGDIQARNEKLDDVLDNEYEEYQSFGVDLSPISPEQLV